MVRYFWIGLIAASALLKLNAAENESPRPFVYGEGECLIVPGIGVGMRSNFAECGISGGIGYAKAYAAVIPYKTQGGTAAFYFGVGAGVMWVDMYEGLIVPTLPFYIGVEGVHIFGDIGADLLFSPHGVIQFPVPTLRVGYLF